MVKHKRKQRLTAILAGTLLAASLAGCGAADAAEDGVITLRFAHFMPSHHTNATDGAELWMQEVEERSGGEVEFEYYPEGQLVSAEQMVPALRAGVVDVGIFTPATAAPADLPLSEIPQVPGFEFSNLRVIAGAYQELLEGPLVEEWSDAGVEPMMSLVSGGYQLLMKGEPRRTPEDWRARSIRSPGGVMDFVADAMGASPTQIAGPQLYEALDRGTVDSSITSLESVPPYDFDEPTDTASLNFPLGAVPMAMGVSLQTYEQLPENVKVAMQEANEVVFELNQDALEDDLDEALDYLEGRLELYELTDQELAAFAPGLEAVQDRWASQRNNGHETLVAWEQAMDNAEKKYGQ